MKQDKQFQINEDVTLVFQSLGKLYQLRLLISSGLMFLKQLEEGKENTERIIFVNEKVKEHENKVKKKRKKKNLAPSDNK